MLEGKALILATKRYAQENPVKSWYYTLSTCFILLALLCGTLYNFHLSLKILCSVLAGLVIVRLFVIYHDHQHQAILSRSKAAEILFTVFGMYTIAPTGIWKRSHDFHHKNNSKLFSASIGSYPIYSKEKYRSASKKEQREYLFTRHPLVILFGYFFMFFYGMILSSLLNNFRKHYDSLIALLVHIGYQVVIGWFFGWQGWLLCCFIPHFISCSIGAYLFYAQHNFPGVKFKDNADWKYELAALESSSYMKMNPFMRWVTANIGYHHIHHLNARVPFYRLPEAMEEMPELQRVTTTSLHPKDIIACLRLKVWDPERQQMTGL